MAYKDHTMSKGKASVTTRNEDAHNVLKADGWGHPLKMRNTPLKGFLKPSPTKFKGANSSNSKCWPGFKKVGTKISPSGTGETVNDCEKK